jgi:hypothetical protein
MTDLRSGFLLPAQRPHGLNGLTGRAGRISHQSSSFACLFFAASAGIDG